jgi:hypothetical protein
MMQESKLSSVETKLMDDLHVWENYYNTKIIQQCQMRNQIDLIEKEKLDILKGLKEIQRTINEIAIAESSESLGEKKEPEPDHYFMDYQDYFYNRDEHKANNMMFTEKLQARPTQGTTRDGDYNTLWNRDLRDLRKILIAGFEWNGRPKAVQMNMGPHNYVYQHLVVALFLRHLMIKTCHKMKKTIEAKKNYDFEIVINLDEELKNVRRFGRGSALNYAKGKIPKDSTKIGVQPQSLLHGFRSFLNLNSHSIEQHLNLVPGSKSKTAIMRLFTSWFYEMFYNCEAKFERRGNSSIGCWTLIISSSNGRKKTDHFLREDFDLFEHVCREWDHQFDNNRKIEEQSSFEDVFLE